MKSYREIADTVFARRDAYIIQQRRKKQIVARTTVSVGSVALVSLAGFALHKNGGFREKLPVADGTPTTTTTTTPTQTQDTTTATTTVPTQTQDTTTATTTATGESTTSSKTNPTQTTATTSGKTEPTKTTATTVTKHKLVISGEKPDVNCVEVNESGAYQHGVISPLLKETMERYKDVDDVDVLFAVIVAVRYREADDYDDLYNAFLASDEMVELARRRDLALEEWEAADSENHYQKREAYLTLRREYDRKESEFRLAHRNAGLDESLAILSQFSEFDLIPLKDRLKPDMDWSEEFPIKCALILSEYEEHAYVAVLSADEILELSERIGCMYWLDSHDDNFNIPGMLDE